MWMCKVISTTSSLSFLSQNATDPCDEAEMKLRREGVLNQLLLMLNTAAKDKDEEGGDMEYLHGSLGLVPVD